MAQITPGLFDISGMLPALTQGFTKLGGAPGRVGMMDKLMGMNPIQQAEYQRSQAKTPAEFMKADANVRAALQTSGQQSIEAIRAELLRETDPARQAQLEQAMVDVAKQTGNKAGDYAGYTSRLQAALKVANQRGDQASVTALQQRALDPVDYLKGLATAKPEKKEYNFSEETIMVDGKPTRVQVAVNKANPNDIQTTLIGSAEPKEGRGGGPTLEQQLRDAGVENFDLTTLEGAQQARRDIISQTGNASLANAVGAIIDDLTPMSVREALQTVRDIDPRFAQAEGLKEQIERFATLSSLTPDDIAGLAPLLERTLTATTENDLRAVAELDRFRQAKDLPQRMKDFVLQATTGKLSDETIQEYSALAAAFEELADYRMRSGLQALIISGDPKESDAAKRTYNMMFGKGTARILP